MVWQVLFQVPGSIFMRIVIQQSCSWRTRLYYAAATVMSVFAPSLVAAAATVEVTAEFAPSALNPSHNEFTNTTKPGVYCTWLPTACSASGAYFFDVPINASKTYLKGGGARKHFYVRLPAPRIAQLTHTSSGVSYPIELAFQAVSGHLSPGGTTNPVFTLYPRGGCAYIRTVSAGSWVRFGWTVRAPDSPQACHSSADGATGFTRTYNLAWLGLGMRIRSPSPLELPSGEYEGVVNYSVGGEDADIDLGDDVIVDPQITLMLRFTVKHAFQVIFPAENPRVALVPVGGWKQWTDYGRLPVSMRQELPFSLTSSTEFSMKLRCEQDVEGRCGIRNLVEDVAVPIDVDVTMPGMRNLRDGRPAQDTPLLPDDARAPRFAPDGYLMERRSILRFTAKREAVTEMFKAPGSRWEGNVTVVFDANP